MNFAKIIYFDETSATDLLYISNGGKFETTKEDVIEKAKSISANAEAKAEAKIPFFNFFKAHGNIGGASSINREEQNILNQVLTSTILTDYLDIAQNSDNIIKTFSEFNVYPYPESFSYYKMLTPYMTMTEGQVDIGSDIKLNIAMMDQAFEQGRGYYEMIAQKESDRYVLRFNIKAFRNNYSISDLVKMELNYHAIKVGTVSEQSLRMDTEFSLNSKELSGYEINGAKQREETELPVYDVLLAGVLV